jgi:hypothetical protein
MKPEDLITYGLIIGAIGFGLRIISWSAITIIDYLNNPIVVKTGDAVVTETIVVLNSVDFNGVMLKPFLHQIDYIGGCLFYTGIATVLFILILTVSDKTQLNFSEKLTAGSDSSDIVINGITITRLENVRQICTLHRSTAQINRYKKRLDDAMDIAEHARGSAESKYSEAFLYMKGYFPTDPWVTIYLKVCMRLVSRKQTEIGDVEMFGRDTQQFVSDTVVDYINKRDPVLAQDLAIHIGSALMEFAVWLTSSGTGTPL